MLIKALGNYIKNVSGETFEVLSQNGNDNEPEPPIIDLEDHYGSYEELLGHTMGLTSPEEQAEIENEEYHESHESYENLLDNK